MKPIVVYVGTQEWRSRPEIIQPSRTGRVGEGPGLYFTTSRTTAMKYGKGSRTVLRVEIDPSVKWLEGAVVHTALLVDWVKSQPGMRHKSEIIADIIERGTRGLPGNGEYARASSLLNLMLHYGVVTGARGPALANFLSSLGIDASHVRRGSGEEWIVLFSPKKILSWRKATDDDPWDLPSVRS